METAKDVRPGFGKPYLTMSAHENAIMDMEFSMDDNILATASGDQSAKIIDMQTQKTLHILGYHDSSLRQVRIQPGTGDKIVATSSRDGTVMIWDLRTRQLPAVRQNVIVRKHDPIGAAQDAHLPSKSVTSLAFLKGGREHMLVTASEANACVKLWDIRSLQSNSRAKPKHLSSTRSPTSHRKTREYGVTCLTLSGDGSRLYATCRDSAIYAYSTQHLILGHAPELAADSGSKRPSKRAEKEGLGPLYSFRHPELRVSTFYVKAALRKASGDQTELLSVGSSENCAILFPTDERYMVRQSSDHEPLTAASTPTPHSAMRRRNTNNSQMFSSSGMTTEGDAPVYRHGTALLGGHSKEVTACTWTSNGELVTTSDQCDARCWREGPEARKFRQAGPGDGWQCGWADVESSWDEDEG